MSRWFVTIFAVLLLSATAAEAAVERFCLVSLNVINGWSPERKLKITFVTGLELSRAAKSLRFGFRENYALIWPGTGLPIIVKIDAIIIGVGQTFTANDFQEIFGPTGERQATQLEGEGRGLKWRIKARTSEGWVDPQS